MEIEKPLETSPLEPGADGMMEYCACQYVVLGSCEENYRHTVGGVEVCKARNLVCGEPGADQADSESIKTPKYHRTPHST